MRAKWRIYVALMTGATLAQAEAPPAPVDPDVEDCQLYNQEVTRWTRQAHDAVRHCFQAPPTFAIGLEVDIASGNCEPRRGSRAWPQCFDYERKACETARDGRREFTACMERARHTTQDLKTFEGAYREGRRRNDQFQKITNNFERAQRFLLNPKRMVFDELVKHSYDQALTMFDPNGVIRPDGTEKLRAIYDVGLSTARKGTETTTRSPVIGAIQSTAIDAITGRFNSVIREFDTASDELSHFEIDAPARDLSPLPARADPGAVRVGCEVLKDPARSRALMQQDEVQWLELVGRCE